MFGSPPDGHTRHLFTVGSFFSGMVMTPYLAIGEFVTWLANIKIGS